MRHPVFSLLENQWKLRQQLRISQRREGHCRTNTTVRRKIYVQKNMTVSKDWLIERKSSMLDEIESKTVHIDEEGDR